MTFPTTIRAHMFEKCAESHPPPERFLRNLAVKLPGRRGALASARCTTGSAQSGSSGVPELAPRRRLAGLLCKFAGLEMSYYVVAAQPANLRGCAKSTCCIRRVRAQVYIR